MIYGRGNLMTCKILSAVDRLDLLAVFGKGGTIVLLTDQKGSYWRSGYEPLRMRARILSVEIIENGVWKIKGACVNEESFQKGCGDYRQYEVIINFRTGEKSLETTPDSDGKLHFEMQEKFRSLEPV